MGIGPDYHHFPAQLEALERRVEYYSLFSILLVANILPDLVSLAM